MSQRPPEPIASALNMSNFDHSIADGLAEELKATGGYAQHAAYNFCGYVWWDGKEFVEEVWIYNAPQETLLRAETLEEIMAMANAEYGSD